MEPSPRQIAFMGAGRMAGAMVRGLIDQAGLEPSGISCTCGDDPTGPELSRTTGIHYQPDSLALVRDTDILVLACKPQQLDDLGDDLGETAQGVLLLSILAGIPLSTLQAKFPRARAWVRAMPNTPGQVAAGVTAFASSRSLEDGDRQTVDLILGALGTVVEVEEDDLDAVTALSGSGPAYFFALAEAMAEGGRELGLRDDLAALLARETLIGAAKLVDSVSKPLSKLREEVTSPGGTTAAALQAFEREDWQGVVKRAMRAAARRSRQLAEGK
jgi:pyrroline-5-carboxylate reductase